MSIPRNKLTGRKVLLAEDCPDTREVLAHILTKSGAEVVCKENGLEALECVLDAEESTSPFNLVLLDIQMPKLDGLSAAKEMRRHGLKVPIVSVTARSAPEDEDESISIGCTGYISKLAGPQRIIDEISKHLNEHAPGKTILPSLPLVPQYLIDNPDKAEKALKYIEQIPERMQKILECMVNQQFSEIVLVTNALAPLSFYGYHLFTQELQKVQEAALAEDAPQLESAFLKLKKIARNIIAGKTTVSKLVPLEH